MDTGIMRDARLAWTVSGLLLFSFLLVSFMGSAKSDGTQFGIWDSTDIEGGMHVIGPGDNVTFFADYGGLGYCLIEINGSGTWSNMPLNVTSDLYEYSEALSETGIFEWIVDCNGAEANDTVHISSVEVQDYGNYYKMGVINTKAYRDEFFIRKNSSMLSNDMDDFWAQIDLRLHFLSGTNWFNYSLRDFNWTTKEVLNNLTGEASLHFHTQKGNNDLDVYFILNVSSNYIQIRPIVYTNTSFNDSYFFMNVTDIKVANTPDNDIAAFYNINNTRMEFNLSDPGWSGTKAEQYTTCRPGMYCGNGTYFEFKDSQSGKYAWFVMDPENKTDDFFFAQGGYYPDAYVVAQSHYGELDEGTNYSMLFYWNDPVYECDSCSYCNTVIGAAASGDTVELNASIGGVGGTCIDFNDADNLTLDCKGFTISGDGGGTDYGIYLENTGDGSNNNTIRNCASVSNFAYGLFMQSSTYNTVTNSTFQENTVGDFFILSSGTTQCSHTIQNLTGSGGRPIEYYNYTVDLQDKTLSELVLCDAGNSTLTNITIMGSDTIGNNYLLITKTQNATLSEINSSYNYHGIWVYGSDSNNFTDITVNSNTLRGIFVFSGSSSNAFTNITASYNTQSGIHLGSGNGNTFTDTTANYNTQNGFYVGSDSNTITSSTASYNTESGIKIQGRISNNITNVTANSNTQYGIYLYAESDSNTINDSRMENNTLAGIYLYAFLGKPSYNLIYNNYLNNTQNALILTSDENYFNTTLDCTKTNIIGGPCIGGNFWTDPDGSNFSDTCTDQDGNGICDTGHELDPSQYSWDWDNLSLSYTPVLVYLEYPDNDAENATDQTPDFLFNATDLYYSSTYSCTLYLNYTSSGTGTPQPYDMNTSTQNATTTMFTANSTLQNGYYDWWINCTNEYGRTNQSEVRNLSVQIQTSFACSSCAECSDYLQNGTMATGYTLSLSANLSTAGTCISFGGADNLTLDCKGFTISGDGSGYGIWLNDSNGGSNGNTIRNCANVSYFSSGTYIYESMYNIIVNTTFIYNQYGIYLSSSNYTIINGSESSYNTLYGINIVTPKSNTVTNSTLQENGNHDVYFSPSSETECDNEFQNVTGSGGRPIEYYNYSVDLQNKTLSELVLCDAGNSTLTNITIMGSDSINNNQLYISFTDNVTLDTINSSYNFYGISNQNSNSNTIRNAVLDGNFKGIFMQTCDSNNIMNVTATYSTQEGVLAAGSNSNTFTNLTSSYNTQYGIRFYANSDNNTLNDSRLEENGIAGIWLDRQLSTHPEYNLFYNNYLNNSGTNGNVRIDLGITYENYFNTTLDCSSGPNIIGGPCIGGNYWANDTCPDSNGDGICDTGHELSTSYAWAWDNLSLSYTPVLIYLEYPADNTENATDWTPDFLFNVTDSYYSSMYSCTLYMNRTDSGTGTPQPYGINASVLNGTSTTLTANTSLINGYYDWWVNCTNQYGRTNQSEVRNLSMTMGITITSPLNQTYTSIPISVSLTTSKTAESCWYNLDGGTNASLTNSSALDWSASMSPPEALHQLFVYCNDTLGSLSINSSVWFTYATPSGYSGGDYGGSEACGDYTLIPEGEGIRMTGASGSKKSYLFRVWNGPAPQHFFMETSLELWEVCELVSFPEYPTDSNGYAEFVLECTIQDAPVTGEAILTSDSGCYDTREVTITESSTFLEDLEWTVDLLFAGDIYAMSNDISFGDGFSLPFWAVIVIIIVIIIIILAILREATD